MNNQTRAGILIGCLNIQQSKTLFGLLGYEERNRLIKAIVHLPTYGKEEEWEVVRECLDLIKGETLHPDDDYKHTLSSLMNEKGKRVASYVTSLIGSKTPHQN